MPLYCKVFYTDCEHMQNKKKKIVWIILYGIRSIAENRPIPLNLVTISVLTSTKAEGL